MSIAEVFWKALIDCISLYAAVFYVINEYYLCQR